MTPLVLIIEDDEIQRKVLRAYLDERYEVKEASSLVTGIESAVKHRPDVVLLDLNLSDFKGLQTLANFVRAAPDPLVVVVTGDSTAIGDMGEGAIANGASDVLLKPYQCDEVLGVVVRAIARSRTWKFSAPVAESMDKLRDTLQNCETLSDSKVILPHMNLTKSRPPDTKSPGTKH